MNGYTRRQFELEFSALADPPVSEFVIYTAMKFAEAYPLYVKEPFRFLVDKTIPESEKKRLLRATYETADNPIEFLSYVMQPAKGLLSSTAALGVTRQLNAELYRLVRKARKHGIDVGEELKEVFRRRRRLLEFRDANEKEVTPEEYFGMFSSLDSGTVH